MIRLQVDPKSISELSKRVHDKTDQSKELIGPKSLAEIAKIVFTLSSKKILRDIAAEAIQNPNRYHHLYEWSELGHNKQKLFQIKRERVINGNLIVAFVPMKSRAPVPIADPLKVPGPTGKVISSRHIFAKKMEIMEEGRPIYYESKTVIPISPNNEDIVFIPKGRAIKIMHPGGPDVKGSLQRYVEKWYSSENFASVLSGSRAMKEIQSQMINEMQKPNSTKESVRNRIKAVAAKYSDNDKMVF